MMFLTLAFANKTNPCNLGIKKLLVFDDALAAELKQHNHNTISVNMY